METLAASTLPQQDSQLAISSRSPIITAARPGSRTNVPNAPKDGTSTRRESAAKCPHFVASSIEPRVSARPVIRDTPSSTTAANLQNRTWDVLNGTAMSAGDVQRDGGKMPMEFVNLSAISVQPGANRLENV